MRHTALRLMRAGTYPGHCFRFPPQNRRRDRSGHTPNPAAIEARAYPGACTGSDLARLSRATAGAREAGSCRWQFFNGANGATPRSVAQLAPLKVT